MTRLVKTLWRGELPLGRAFWEYGIAYGLLLNLAFHFLFLALLVNEARPVLLAVAFLAPLPFNGLVVVAVWRSAGRYQGPKARANLARLGVVVWMAALTLT